MIKQAYEAGVKQAVVDALSGGPVGAPAIKPTPPTPIPIASPPSPTMVAGNKISPAATMAPKPTEVGETQTYNEGVKQAMIDAGLLPLTKSADAGEGFRYGGLGGTGLSVAGILAHLLSKGKYGFPPDSAALYGPALLGGGIGAGIGALAGD
jgi:hypothetical protein